MVCKNIAASPSFKELFYRRASCTFPIAPPLPTLAQIHTNRNRMFLAGAITMKIVGLESLCGSSIKKWNQYICYSVDTGGSHKK